MDRSNNIQAPMKGLLSYVYQEEGRYSHNIGNQQTKNILGHKK